METKPLPGNTIFSTYSPAT